MLFLAPKWFCTLNDLLINGWNQIDTPPVTHGNKNGRLVEFLQSPARFIIRTDAGFIAEIISSCCLRTGFWIGGKSWTVHATIRTTSCSMKYPMFVHWADGSLFGPKNKSRLFIADQFSPFCFFVLETSILRHLARYFVDNFWSNAIRDIACNTDANKFTYFSPCWHRVSQQWKSLLLLFQGAQIASKFKLFRDDKIGISTYLQANRTLVVNTVVQPLQIYYLVYKASQ